MRASAWMMGLAMVIGIGFAAAPAAADETQKAAETVKKSDAAAPKAKDDNYGYVFKDDLLNAPGMGATTGQITVLKLGRRDRLLRPRLHFVPEMLKSVESM
ncbi:MAG: hypothetical protein IT372_31200 [Polyangiaceae bacterium]|nr:hypothetical protein [Polyangiaceae bacterium]